MTPGNLVKPAGADSDARPYLPRLAVDVALPGREFINVLHLVGAPGEEERPALTALLSHPETLVRQNASLALALMRNRGKDSISELKSAARRSAGKEQWIHVRAVANIAPAERKTWDLLLEAHGSAAGEERRALEQELAHSVQWGNRDRAALAVVKAAARRASRKDNIYAAALDHAAGRAPRAVRERRWDLVWALSQLWPLLGIAGVLAAVVLRRRPATPSAAPRWPSPAAQTPTALATPPLVSPVSRLDAAKPVESPQPSAAMFGKSSLLNPVPIATAILYAFNLVFLAVCFAGTAFLALLNAIGAVGALLTFKFGSLLFSSIILSVLLLLLRYLARLWRENRDFGQNKPGTGGTATALPVLAGLVFVAGYIVVGKFSAMVKPINARATVGSIGSIRSALSIYYGDLEGLYPEDLTHLTLNGKYLGTIPKAKTLDHPDSDEVTLFPAVAPMDSGTWGYVNNPYDANFGTLFVDCTHTDPRGREWTFY